MDELAYGEGIKILSQAEALVSLLAKAKSALILADQLEPKIVELSRIKDGLAVEIESLQEQKKTILSDTEEAKQRVIAEQASKLATMQAVAEQASEEIQQKLQVELDQLSSRINAKTAALTTLENNFNARKAQLDSEIASSEKQLKESQDALDKLRACVKVNVS